MIEPIPDEHGMVNWNGVRCSDFFIQMIKLEGYKWNEERENYEIETDSLKLSNKCKGIKLDPASFHVDEFRRASGR